MEYEQIEMIAGKEYAGYYQYVKILNVDEREATVYYNFDECHRVERGPVEVMRRFLQMVVDGYQSWEDMESYVENELPNPQIRLVAIWPDDIEYGGEENVVAKLGPEAPGYFARSYRNEIYDIETGEVYGTLEDGIWTVNL